MEAGFSASSPWIEQYDGSDDHVNSGGPGRAVEAGDLGYRINRTVTGLNRRESELWFRAVIQPPSANALGNTMSRMGLGVDWQFFELASGHS